MKQKTYQKLNIARTFKRREFDSVEREFTLLVSQYWDRVEKNELLQLKMKHSVKQLQEIKFYLVVNKEIRQVVQ